MIDFDTYKSFYGLNQSSNDGHIRKIQSDMIIEETWFRDLQSCVCYLYDYKHDNEPTKTVGLTPILSPHKIPVDVKFIVNSYNSDDKTQVPYSIQFKPSQRCNVLYYEEEFTKKCNSEFPLGLYIDIPDSQGVYRRWLIYQNGNKYNQFITWSVLPCNYRFSWIDNGKKYQMWGVRRLSSSYSDGLSEGTRITILDSNKIIWLPFNDISNTLTYDKRLIISANSNEPAAWRVTGVENVDFPGVNRITILSDKFNRNKDYIEKDDEGNIVAMWADYYESTIVPTDPVENDDFPSNDNISIEILYKGLSSTIKVGGSYKTLYVQRFNENNEMVENNSPVSWSFNIGGMVLDNNLIEVITVDNNTVKVKFLGDIDYIGQIIEAAVTIENVTTTTELEIVGL